LKLEEIQEFWNADREIDITELATESVRIPQIHDKYLKIYIDERIRLKGLQFELTKLVRLKTDYYAGKLTQEELEKLGWEQFLQRLLKNEISTYIESDSDIIKHKKNIVLIEEKCYYLDSIIKMISNRGFQIKGAIDWIKYKSGIV
jgi:hypothetical protein|tara:strand:+ start:4719 stop:5156 length:438 start_codon:yes stop_codon:yes gene_type:complete